MSIPLTDRESPFPAGSGSQFTAESILRDYRLAFQSRQASLIGRREVFTGKAKFGIFGDGKEVAQVALARAFRPGDFRSGYYRDQTLMMALGLLTVEQLFAQLYADADLEREPCSAGRSMTAHFSTCMLEPDGSFRSLADLLNSSSDVSPTGSQMPRLVGLAQASRLYRELPELQGGREKFSRNGDEIAFGTTGNASCGTTATASRSPTSTRSPRGTSRPSSPASAVSRRAARGTTSTRSRAGTTPASARPTSAPPRSCAPSTCRRSSTSPR
jgi:hypothetical protein